MDMALTMADVMIMRTGMFAEKGDIEDVMTTTAVQSGYQRANPLSNIMVKAYNGHRASIVKTMKQILPMLEQPDETDLTKFMLGSYLNAHADLQHMQVLVREMKGLHSPLPGSAFYNDGTLPTHQQRRGGCKSRGVLRHIQQTRWASQSTHGRITHERIPQTE